jgi:aarF domain-containing kinase
VLLDHGLYETLSVDVRENLCNFWEALVRTDYEAMKKYAAALEVSGK